MQPRLRLELGPSSEHRRWHIVLGHLVPALLIVDSLPHVVVVVVGPVLIVDSFPHVVVVAGQGVQEERQHAQLEVCDHVNPQFFNNSRYVMWAHNFSSHLYISRGVLLKTKVFDARNFHQILFWKGGHIELKGLHESYLKWVFSRSQEKRLLEDWASKVKFFKLSRIWQLLFRGTCNWGAETMIVFPKYIPRQIFWEIFQLISSAASQRENIQESIKRCSRTNPRKMSKKYQRYPKISKKYPRIN